MDLDLSIEESMGTLQDSFIMEHNYFERITTSIEDCSDSEGTGVTHVTNPDSVMNNVKKDTVVKFLPGMKSAVKNTESHTMLNKNARINTSVRRDVEGQGITTDHLQKSPSKPSKTTSTNPKAHFPQKIPVKLIIKNQGQAPSKINIPSKLLLMPAKNNVSSTSTALQNPGMTFPKNTASDKLVGFIFSWHIKIRVFLKIWKI